MEQVQDLIETLLPGIHPGAYLVSLSGSLETKLHLSVDTDAGITLGECAQINLGLRDALGAQLGEAAVPEMEVASPGVGEPLRLHRQYVSNVGRKLSLRLQSGEYLQGELQQVAPEALHMGIVKLYNPKSPHPPKLQPQTIALSDILETKVILEYSA